MRTVDSTIVHVHMTYRFVFLPFGRCKRELARRKSKSRGIPVLFVIKTKASTAGGEQRAKHGPRLVPIVAEGKTSCDMT